jgi:hypothetical protein
MGHAECIKTNVIKWLLKGNLSFNISKDSIGAEVPFSRNRRRVDLLILSNQFHALEIKSDFDDPRNLESQLKDYRKVFDKVSVIATPKHFKRITKIIKPYTGLILFESNSFQIKKNAKQRKKLDKYSLLMFLSKHELANLSKVKNSKSLSTDEIRKILANKLTINEIRKATYSSLRKRYNELFRLFMNDTGGKIIWDDLKGLCGRIDELY